MKLSFELDLIKIKLNASICSGQVMFKKTQFMQFKFKTNKIYRHKQLQLSFENVKNLKIT